MMNKHKIYPRSKDRETVYLKNVVTDPSIIVGDYTMYNDFVNDPTNFQKNNVLHHYPINHDRLIIGKFCSIACGARFLFNSANHSLTSLATYPFPIFFEKWGLDVSHITEAWDNKGDIVIGNDVWIGYEASILAGVTIGDGAIIGTRAVVTKDVPPYTIVGGIPARQIRKRFSDEVISTLLTLKWWDWPEERIAINLDAIQSGHIDLTEEFFPEHDIRLVAVSDNIDTAEGENELAPIRNLFNEWYARDISKKRRISNKIKGNAGEPMGQPPYGYIKDPDNPKRWIVDDEATQVVRRIYSMTLEGYGTEQIATQLERDEILTPRAYWLKKGIKRPGKGKQQPATKWNSSTVTKILSLQEYCGDILNFKTYSKSYKNKKRLENDRENWVIFKDVHEPIIERSVFEQVQQKRGKIRKRRTNEGEHNMFSGLLVCADCGSNLHFHFNQGNPEIEYFNCSNYKGNRGSCTSTAMSEWIFWNRWCLVKSGA